LGGASEIRTGSRAAETMIETAMARHRPHHRRLTVFTCPLIAFLVQGLRHFKVMLQSRQRLACPVLQLRILA
jgi:hypothetical protein